MGATHDRYIAEYCTVTGVVKLFGTSYNLDENELMKHDGVFAQHSSGSNTM